MQGRDERGHDLRVRLHSQKNLRGSNRGCFDQGSKSAKFKFDRSINVNYSLKFVGASCSCSPSSRVSHSALSAIKLCRVRSQTSVECDVFLRFLKAGSLLEISSEQKTQDLLKNSFSCRARKLVEQGQSNPHKCAQRAQEAHSPAA